MYICNQCDGDVPDRTFELQFNDMKEAEASTAPVCPRCGSTHVARYFGHKVFAARKRRGELPAPDRFVPMKPRHQRGIISIGIRTDEENREEVEKQIEEFAEATQVTLIQPDEETDVTEEVFGLKKGSIERKLFEIRQERMIQDLVEGESISGFFMPISGEYNN